MKLLLLFLTVLTSAINLTTPSAIAADHVPPISSWSYHGKTGFQHWGKLNEQYSTCKTGMEQSPINISKYESAKLPALTPEYQTTKAVVFHNGHAIQVNAPQGGKLNIGGKSYSLLQYHFHTPSEHYVDGSPYPMEVHLVHQAEDGTLGVLGIMMEIGAENPAIQKIWNAIPQSTGEGDAVEISAASLLPAKLDYYHYKGSLTTPPCTEGVQWHVVKNPIQISEKQLTSFQSLFPVNARPIQPIHKRKVFGN